MAVFRFQDKVICFAHIPKCGGSSVEQYLKERFGQIGFCDSRHTTRPSDQRWSRTSPQHIDWGSMQRLLPTAFFDEVFAVVRHPVSRAVSAYHFQVAVEKSVARGVGFSEWLHDQFRAFQLDRFTIDNHFRPQVDFVPATCKVFHIEHGLNAIVPYIDRLVGNADGPRAIGHANQRAGSKGGAVAAKGSPTAEDVALIAKIYAADFTRFGYVPGRSHPVTSRPDVPAGFPPLAAEERARAISPLNRMAKRVWRSMRI